MKSSPVFIVLFDSGDQYEGDQLKFIGVAYDYPAAERIARKQMHFGRWKPEPKSTRHGGAIASWVRPDSNDSVYILRTTPRRSRRVS